MSLVVFSKLEEADDKDDVGVDTVDHGHWDRDDGEDRPEKGTDLHEAHRCEKTRTKFVAPFRRRK